MSCSSCGSVDPISCGCNPCTQVQSQESIASMLQNLVNSLFGAFTKTTVNGRSVWSAVCSPNDNGLSCFPKNSNEGLVCYFLRILDTIGTFNGGIHNSALSYCKHTMVASGASLYLSVQDVPAGTSISNATYWLLMISAPPGTPGPQGPAGSPGAGGSPNFAILVTAVGVSLGDTDAVCICDNPGAIAVTIPAIGATLSGKWFEIVRGVTSAGNVTVTPSGGNTINGAASYVLTVAGEGVEIVSDNLGDWRIL